MTLNTATTLKDNRFSDPNNHGLSIYTPDQEGDQDLLLHCVVMLDQSHRNFQFLDPPTQE